MHMQNKRALRHRIKCTGGPANKLHLQPLDQHMHTPTGLRWLGYVRFFTADYSPNHTN